MKLGLLAIVVCAGLLLAGCGGGGDSSASGSGEAKEPEKGEQQLPQTAVPGPEVKLPEGPPPKKLVINDVRVGSGTEAKTGDKVRVEYVGKRWSGASYSNSWTYTEVPFFTIGKHRLSPGFEQGVEGMKVGGRRELIVPPKLIYNPGEDPRPVQLRPSETLVFLVDLLGVE